MRAAGLIWMLVLLALAATVTGHAIYMNKLRPVYSWRILDFAYNSSNEREQAISNGSFKPGIGVPIDTDIYFGTYSIMFMLQCRCLH